MCMVGIYGPATFSMAGHFVEGLRWRVASGTFDYPNIGRNEETEPVILILAMQGVCRVIIESESGGEVRAWDGQMITRMFFGPPPQQPQQGQGGQEEEEEEEEYVPPPP